MQQAADEELLIQQLESQAAADEAEAQKLIDETTAEEQQARLEYEQAEAEYQAALNDLVKAEQEEDAEINRNLREKDWNDPTTDLGKFAAEERQQLFVSTYQTEYVKQYNEFQTEQANRRKQLERADELQALGMIPMDATNEDRLKFLANIDVAEQEKQSNLEKLWKVRPAVYLLRVERHKALVKAHNAFQKKYRNDILQFRYGFKQPAEGDIQFREVAQYYLPFGVDREHPVAKNAKIFRVFSKIDPPEGDALDHITYSWDEPTKSWIEDDPLMGWKNPKRGNGIFTQTTDKATFYRDGVWPELEWLPTVADQASYDWNHNKGNFYAYFLDGFKRGRWSQKRGFEKCKPGYWFYETLPEEASTCVYMGGSMYDTGSSYYPRSVGFDYKINDQQAIYENKINDAIIESGVVISTEEAKQQAEANNIPIENLPPEVLAAVDKKDELAAAVGEKYGGQGFLGNYGFGGVGNITNTAKQEGNNIVLFT
jgi:hypothetical protein